jgi:metal-dependent HD superfamily phosphatase/phosphodiesterase
MILSSKEIHEWRKAIDASLLKRSEENIDNILSKYPKAQRAWNQLRNDSFMSAQWDMSDYIAVTKWGTTPMATFMRKS